VTYPEGMGVRVLVLLIFIIPLFRLGFASHVNTNSVPTEKT